MYWEAILEDSERIECERSACEVADALDQSQYRAEQLSFGLSAGNAGLAIFYDFLFSSIGRKEDLTRKNECWNKAIDQLADTRNVDLGFFGGYSGLAWAECLLKRDSPEEELTSSSDIYEDVEMALLDDLAQLGNPCHFDLVRGFVGSALFALERWPRPRAVQALQRIVDVLDERAESVPEGVRWATPPSLILPWRREKYPNGYWNLGVAHGVPAIWYVLANVARRNIRRSVALSLLERSISWVLSQRIKDSPGLVFPDVVCDEEPRPSFLRWCYGDLGIAAVLLTVARCIKSSEWEEVARQLGRNAARISFRDAGVRDTGLCHGAAGVGHTFNRLYQATGEEIFRDAARTWLKQALHLRLKDEGVAGYAAWISDSRRADGTFRWVPRAGLLNGAAGTALALLAGCRENEPQWDRFLCLSYSQDTPGAGRAA